MEIHVDLAVLLAVVLVFRLRRRTEARSRGDEMVTAVLAITLGLLLMGTTTGTALLGAVQTVAQALGAD